MDVLEHVEDDLGLLQAYVSKAPPNCDVFISVPAFQFLWSGHDEFLEHYRRYTVPQVERVVQAAGLEVVSASYGFGAVFPIALVRRQFQKLVSANKAPQSDLKQHSAPVNGMLALLCALERPFQHLNRAAGLSVFCLARKP